MSNNYATAHASFDAIRKDFHSTKKVGVYFKALFDLANSEVGATIRNEIIGQYNFDAAKLPADALASCASKYGFPVRMED